MQIRWLTFGADVNPFERYNPLRPLVHWYNTRRMNKYVSRELKSRLANYQGNEGIQSAKRTKTVIDLALAAYLSENPRKRNQSGYGQHIPEICDESNQIISIFRPRYDQ